MSHCWAQRIDSQNHSEVSRRHHELHYTSSTSQSEDPAEEGGMRGLTPPPKKLSRLGNEAMPLRRFHSPAFWGQKAWAPPCRGHRNDTLGPLSAAVVSRGTQGSRAGVDSGHGAGRPSTPHHLVAPACQPTGGALKRESIRSWIQARVSHRVEKQMSTQAPARSRPDKRLQHAMVAERYAARLHFRLRRATP